MIYKKVLTNMKSASKILEKCNLYAFRNKMLYMTCMCREQVKKTLDGLKTLTVQKNAQNNSKNAQNGCENFGKTQKTLKICIFLIFSLC